MKKRAILVAGIMLLFAVTLVANSKNNLEYFEVGPNPMDEKCIIELSFATETAIVLTIETLRGDVIRTLYSGNVHKYSAFNWERDDAHGNWVAPGEYHVVVNYQSRYTSTKKTLILK
jgi:hypothetical protein